MTTTNWNPSPPNSPPCSRDSLVPSLDEPSTSSEYSDTIGETVFSKSWVLSLMVQAVAAVQDNHSGNQGNKETPHKDHNDGTHSGTEENSSIIASGNLINTPTNSLCTLADQDCLYVMPSKHHETHSEAEAYHVSPTDRTQSPINTSDDDSSDKASKELESDLCRLWDASMNKVWGVWHYEILHSPVVLPVVLFILESSRNDELLVSVSAFLDRLFDSSDEVLHQWVDQKLVEAICVAAKQAEALHSFEAMCSLIMTLQLLTTVDEGLSCVVEYEQMLWPHMKHFLHRSLDHVERHLKPLLAAVTLLHTLIDHSKSNYMRESISDKESQRTLQLLHKDVSVLTTNSIEFCSELCDNIVRLIKLDNNNII